MQHDWPGNVRELENTIQRFLNLNILEFVETGAKGKKPVKSAKPESTVVQIVRLREAAQQFEKEHILQQLEACRWNRTRTAKILGIQRKNLYLKMKQLNITTGVSE